MKESEKMESERVKMKSRGKLSNDGKVKFVCPENMWDEERKLVGLKIYVNYTKTYNFLTL